MTVSKQTDTENLEKAACTGPDMHPTWFDKEEFYPLALKICDTCTVRLWCLQRVDPANSWYEGVAGGQVWVNEKPLYLEERYKDPILLQYMATATDGAISHARSIRHNKEPDEVAIAGFLRGDIVWNKLTTAERRIAAQRMWAAGASTQEIVDATHLNGATVTQITRS